MKNQLRVFATANIVDAKSRDIVALSAALRMCNAKYRFYYSRFSAETPSQPKHSAAIVVFFIVATEI